ncbi:MAG: DUF1294 domain-containing protein [Pelagimonas sp.]|uniref:DUF1294 domain-containing protein n=1 Tax=Pelagimonas sp. TaxID=2073170 RepID=UPI003D6B469E
MVLGISTWGLPALIYGCVINVAAFLAFWVDKRRAKTHEWRIPEKTLLGLAVAGGSPGAKLAQIRLRHKTRKQPFATLLNLIIGLQLLFAVSLLFPGGRTAVIQRVLETL